MATILVVEDSTSVQQFLKKELEAMGHKAVVADNGLAALEEVDPQALQENSDRRHVERCRFRSEGGSQGRPGNRRGVKPLGRRAG